MKIEYLLQEPVENPIDLPYSGDIYEVVCRLETGSQLPVCHSHVPISSLNNWKKTYHWEDREYGMRWTYHRRIRNEIAGGEFVETCAFYVLDYDSAITSWTHINGTMQTYWSVYGQNYSYLYGLQKVNTQTCHLVM